MKKLGLLVSGLIVATVLFTGCSHGKSKDTTQITKTKSVNFASAQKLGDEVVAAYLGKSVDTHYGGVLSGITPLADDNASVTLSKEANYKFEGMLSTAVVLPQDMPGSRYYVQPAPGDKTPVIAVNSPMGKLATAIYPKGIVPDMELATDTGDATTEFSVWFVQQAQRVGLLDKRVQLGDNNTLCINAGDCTKSKGGNTVNVFGTKYTVDVITKEDTQTSPVYNMKLKSYMYFDTGAYKAVYETDPSGNVGKTVDIEVNFAYNSTGDESIDTEKYLTGVTNLTVSVQGR